MNSQSEQSEQDDRDQQPPSIRVHAFGDDALGGYDAVGLATAIAARTVSPEEAVAASIDRVARVDEVLAAVAYDAAERARAESRDPRPGFFSGVPTFVKDNSDVAGMPTQNGSRAWVARPASTDGDYARMLLGTGAVALGKTRLSEFGFSAAAEYPDDPPVRNPWHTGFTSGASSAGSAALVAAGAVPFAHANDGGGSIRIPASCCGLVGLKPTRGRTPSDKTMREMPVRIVADGVLTRSVRDTAAFLREAEKIYRLPALPPVGDIRGPGPRRLRIAVVTDSIGGRAIHPENRSATEEVAALLEGLGHRIEPVPPPVPASFARDFQDYWSLLAAVLLATGRRQLGPDFDRARTDNLSRGMAAAAKRRAAHLPMAIARLRASSRTSRRFFRSYDAVLSPVLAHPTPRLGHLDPSQPFEVVMDRLLDWVAFTPLQNATGDPAISLPTHTSSDGTPIGVQIGAGRGEEALLLSLAYEIEQARPWARIDAA